MGRAAFVTITIALAAIVAASIAIAEQSRTVGRVDIPLKQWVGLEMPLRGRGPMGPIKHLTAAHNPDDGRIYMTGGDYRGTEFDQSYRQETWSLSLGERWASRADRNAGWRLEYPYCGPAGQMQPKHPDFVGWTWDSKRKVFWMVPGVMEVGTANCPGETGARTSDPGFRLNRIMQFDPAARQWRDVSGNVGQPAETWMSVYDPKNDSLIRFGYSGGGGAMVSTYRIGEDRWVNRSLSAGAGRREIRINKEYLAVDHAERVIYAIDGVAGRLYRYRMDTQAMEDLGAVPGGPHGRENYMYVVWDSTSKVLLWFRYDPPGANAYHPTTRTWETIPLAGDVPGVRPGGRVAVYDPLHNVTVLFGSHVETSHLFLYRYGDGP